MADDSANSCNDILAADPRRGDKSGMVIQTDQLLVHHTEFYSINVFQWVYSAIFHIPMLGTAPHRLGCILLFELLLL